MMDEPLAFLLTWTCYGTWLPGDSRGWTARNAGQQSPNERLREFVVRNMNESETTLSQASRTLVEATIAAHCEIRGWKLWAVNARTNHVHVVVTANANPDVVMQQFKAWCTRKLKVANNDQVRASWWTRSGSTRYLNTESDLQSAIEYVLNAQDKKHLDHPKTSRD